MALLCVRQHLAQRRLVGLRGDDRSLEAAFPAARLARQNVLFERLAARELPRPGLLEPLGGTSMCLQLRHDLVSSLIRAIRVHPWPVSTGGSCPSVAYEGSGSFASASFFAAGFFPAFPDRIVCIWLPS